MLSLEPWLDDLFDGPPHAPRLRLIDAGGGAGVIPLPLARWHGRPGPEELAVLAKARSPVLDVGCGPGRHARALADAGQVVLGIDISEAAVRSARRRGAPAVRASIFGDVPGAGGWMTLLLLDGNIGIGGDALSLLRRCRDLLRPGGTVLTELDPPGVKPGRYHARVEHGGRRGPVFPWARLGLAELIDLAADSQFIVGEAWRAAGRWFAQLNAN
jgi:SAM-dependent methyltransferase